jgi:hypothetical protein
MIIFGSSMNSSLRTLTRKPLHKNGTLIHPLKRAHIIQDKKAVWFNPRMPKNIANSQWIKIYLPEDGL